MKNSSKLLALGLVLFLGACSAAEGDFLAKVQGKTVAEMQQKFSADGKTFGEAPYAFKFTEATDENTGSYTLTVEGQTSTYTFTTTDGKTGTILMTGETVPGPITFTK